jgi:hypothetical protein
MHCSKLHPHSITSLAVESSVGGTIRPRTSAVLRLTGQAEVYDAVPCLWSNQYDLRPLTVGLSIGHDDIVVRGRPETRTFHCALQAIKVCFSAAGSANLKGLSSTEHAHALIGLAHPQFRDELTAAAKKLNLI